MFSLFELFSQINDTGKITSCSQEPFNINKTFLSELIENKASREYKQEEIEFAGAYFSKGFDITLFSALNETALEIFNLSFNAFDNILHAWLSELPVEREIVAFGKNVIAVCQSAEHIEEKRRAADKAACDRLDPDALAVTKAMAKVYREIDRMMGLLRFSPDDEGVFTAKCAPDHFVLPALGEYFTSRFGGTSWSIIDEKRNLCLRRVNKEKAKIFFLNERAAFIASAQNSDEWEELWKHYHNTINNEDRSNPNLQRQLMPQRYWKYLPEK